MPEIMSRAEIEDDSDFEQLSPENSALNRQLRRRRRRREGWKDGRRRRRPDDVDVNVTLREGHPLEQS
uniref:Uncharacterized protein n=1 Tax=Physcomitrium patens TaxID=3218 RepID=A0A2K1LAA3_PHYPA|nr:hypothetical protein PHYPA_001370 [Physcomitrium patens]